MTHTGPDPRRLARTIRAATAFCIGVLAATGAAAHYIWIERDDHGAKLYFGEVDEVREISPGRLDEIKSPVAWAGTATAKLNLPRGSTHLDLRGTLAPQLLAHEVGVEVKDWSRQGIGMVKPMFYARHSAWPVAITPAPQHKLDIVPVGGSRSGFKVYFAGRPLAKAKVALHAPNDWSQEHRSGDDGSVSLALPWAGQYLLEVIHKEEIGGEFEGRRFEALRHRSTLTIMQTQGQPIRGTGGGAAAAATREKLAAARLDPATEPKPMVGKN